MRDEVNRFRIVVGIKVLKPRICSYPAHLGIGLTINNSIIKAVSTWHSSPPQLLQCTAQMTAATSFSPALAPSPSPSSSKTLKPAPKTLGGLRLGFLSSKTALKPLKARAFTGSSLRVQAVSVPAMKPPTTIDFETSVFNKEKITLAGHDEVLFHASKSYT